LVDAMVSRRLADRTVYSETQYPRLHYGWSDLASAFDGRYHFIRAPRPELYDLASDPGARSNLAASRGSAASAMAAWLERATAGTPAPQPAAADAEARERLRAQQLAAAGRDAEVIAALKPVAAREPDMLDAWELVAKSLIKLGRTKEGIDAFGKVLAIDPLKPETHLALARVYALERDGARARQHAELAAKRDPAGAYAVLAELMMDAGKPGEAAALARRSVEADPSRYMSLFLIAAALQREGNCGEAIPAFTRAIDAKRHEPQAVV